MSMLAGTVGIGLKTPEELLNEPRGKTAFLTAVSKVRNEL